VLGVDDTGDEARQALAGGGEDRLRGEQGQGEARRVAEVEEVAGLGEQVALL
jgi:hypothetical protein